MAVQEITSVPFVTPDTISDSASCFVESNGEFKRMTFEDLEILLTEGGALASYKKVKSDSENNNTLVLNDSKAVIGRLAGIEVVIPYKATGYNSITLEGSYATGNDSVNVFSLPLLIGISPSPGVFYGGTLSISADGTYTLTYRYDSEGEILDPSESVTATNVEALIHGIPHVPCTYECVSGSDNFEFYLSYYLSEYGRAADAKLTYDKINTLTAQHTTDVTRIEAEIEEIVAPTGEAPSVAEVLDARVDVDGVTHNTLGGAIRAQINSVKDSIQDVEDSADAKILAEENARMAGDTQLQSDLDLEIQSRQSLQGEVTTLQGAVNVLASDLDTEESARESADSSLSDRITALDTTKFDAENVVNNLTTEDSGYALDARQGKALSDILKASWGTASFGGSVDASMIPDRVGLYLCYICASPASASASVSVDILYGTSLIIRQLGVGNGSAYGGICALAIVSATDTTTPIVFKSSNASSNAVYNRYGMMWIGNTGTRILPINN